MTDLKHKCRPLCQSGRPYGIQKFHSNANRLRYGGIDEGYEGDVR